MDALSPDPSPARGREEYDRAHALQRIALRMLRDRMLANAPPADCAPWDANYFGLAKVARFRQSDRKQQDATLANASASLLAESWCIERSGVVFCAKMVLLAESFEEKRVYALIGADEATHSAWLEPWIGERTSDEDPFCRFIAGLVDAGNAQPLAFLLQVVLEGFGIVHYSGLAEDCRDAVLAATLKRMAHDEALHHAAGLAAFRADRLSERDKRFVVDGAYTFLQMIRSGPQAVVAAIDCAIGVSGRADAAFVFEYLAGEETTALKLNRLRRLMMQPGMEWLIQELEDKGLFTPCTVAECAQIYVGIR